MDKLILEIIISSGLGLAIVRFIIKAFKDEEFRHRVKKGISKFWTHFRGTSMLAHDIFYDYKTYLKTTNNVKFQCDEKTSAFQILLTIKIETTIEFVTKFIKDNRSNFKEWVASDFVDEFKKLIELIVETYENRIKEAYLNEFDWDKGAEFYKIIYEENFKPYQNKSIKPLELFLNNISIHDKKDYIRIFLKKIDNALSTTVDDLYVSFNELNGKLCYKH